ncbi:sortase [Nocardioides sp.]|uniref:sortase domain-containing protein n=1 Tax=Nocardioides sp. TaxID=35761 RepID=UPI001A1FA3B5|nr:sortase [Nocardioides sp.]MBJ7356038.1 sortase [Nocardioides sp.]
MTARALLGLTLALALQACAGDAATQAEPEPRRSTGSAGSSPLPAPSTAPPATGTPEVEPVAEPVGPQPGDGRPRRAVLRIPSIDVRVAVVPYVGWTDDAPGTEIQNGGLAASPHGPRGGVGPGGIGNYQVTAHRTSSTRAFEFLPDVRRGERVLVDVREAGGATTRYVYLVTGTRETSFRSPASLRAQRAAVPGRPGASPTEAMITLSTCATQEDHAEGNYWADEFDNPEHRIDKIGVLVAVRQR